MDHKHYQDDEFEQFLQHEVNQHRMYPADHIWKNIRTELHGNPSWHALTIISLLIITSLTISTLLIAPSAGRYQFKQVASAAKKTVSPLEETSVHAPHAKEAYFNQIEPQQITQATIALIAPANPSNATSESSSAQPIEIATLALQVSDHPKIVLEKVNSFLLKDSSLLLPFTAQQPLSSIQLPISALTPIDTIQSSTTVKSIQAKNEMRIETPNTHIPYSVKQPEKTAKIGYQFYITPSKSYRVLSDEVVKDFIQPISISNMAAQNIPLGLSYSAGVNDIVRHKPAVGIEFGVAALYSITKRLKLKTGLQMNIRQYNIETFQTLTPNIATVALVNNRSIENINLFSSYSNNGGYRATQLENRTYQISIPIGMQLELIKGKQLGLNIDASVQPTLALNANTYLLSTDYKNYTDANGLMRKWNINTSIGFNLSFKSRSGMWQLGPQIRYQHLPTYSNRYPIKEQLVDYGIRLAFTKQR